MRRTALPITLAGRFSPLGLMALRPPGNCLGCSMPSSEEYKRSAEECRRAADKADDEIERETLLRMVEQWMRLAEYKAKIEARQGGRNSN